MQVVKKFEKNGLMTVSISSNDAVQYPDDGFEKMKEKAQSMSLPYPYLYDDTQAVARQFDALGRGGQPCSQFSYGSLHIIAVRVNVLASDVRDENLVAVWISIEDQRGFVTLTIASVPLAT